jgi:hypothetical protein
MKRHDHPGEKGVIHGRIAIIKCYRRGIIGGSPDALRDDF